MGGYNWYLPLDVTCWARTRVRTSGRTDLMTDLSPDLLNLLFTPKTKNQQLNLKRLIVSKIEPQKMEKSGKFESIKSVPVTETVIRLMRLDPTPFSAEHSYSAPSSFLIDLNWSSSVVDTIDFDPSESRISVSQCQGEVSKRTGIDPLPNDSWLWWSFRWTLDDLIRSLTNPDIFWFFNPRNRC